MPDEVSAAPSKSSTGAVIQLAIAMALTWLALPFAWGYSFIVTMLFGGIALPRSLLIVALLPAVMALTNGLGARAPFARRRGLIWILAIVGWTMGNLVLVWVQTEPVSDWYRLLFVYLLATYWALFAGWFFFVRERLGLRLLILAVLMTGPFLFVKLVEVKGMMGDSRIVLDWRGRGASSLAAIRSGGGELKADFSKVGPTDFASYLGPDRTGVIERVRLDADWKARPPRLLWKHQVGAGWGAFAVVGDFAVTQEQRGGDEAVVCYTLRGGDEVWSHTTPGKLEGPGGIGPRATPAIDAGRVYSVGGQGRLLCLNGADGKEVWSVDILADNGAENLIHGVCASPLVLDGLIYVCPTGKDGKSLAAYDTATGKKKFATGAGRASYASPMLVTLGGAKQILVFHEAGVSGHEPKTGAVLWTYPWFNEQAISSSQPIVLAGDEGELIVTTAYGKGSTRIRVQRGPDSAWTTKSVWESRQMQTKFSSAVLKGDHVYGLDEAILSCIDAKTGKRTWKGGRYGYGQLLRLGDFLLVLTEGGRLALVEARPDKWVERGNVEAIEGKTWNNLALAGDILVVRNDQEAAAFQLAMSSESSASGAPPPAANGAP